jgi:hypothetical protein
MFRKGLRVFVVSFISRSLHYSVLSFYGLGNNKNGSKSESLLTLTFLQSFFLSAFNLNSSPTRISAVAQKKICLHIKKAKKLAKWTFFLFTLSKTKKLLINIKYDPKCAQKAAPSLHFIFRCLFDGGRSESSKKNRTKICCFIISMMENAPFCVLPLQSGY